MKRTMLTGCLLSFITCVLAVSGTAEEIVLNDGFEMENILYWEFTGTIYQTDYGVKREDVTGDGQESWCFWSIPWDNGTGTLKQWIHVIAGTTYEVGMDVCYFAN